MAQKNSLSLCVDLPSSVQQKNVFQKKKTSQTGNEKQKIDYNITIDRSLSDVH